VAKWIANIVKTILIKYLVMVLRLSLTTGTMSLSVLMHAILAVDVVAVVTTLQNIIRPAVKFILI
jgi:hypothetical protein